MNIVQKLLDRVSPHKYDEERRENEKFEERRRRRLVKVKAEVNAEVEIPPNADDLAGWFGLGEGSAPNADGDGDAG